MKKPESVKKNWRQWCQSPPAHGRAASLPLLQTQACHFRGTYGPFISLAVTTRAERPPWKPPPLLLPSPSEQEKGQPVVLYLLSPGEGKWREVIHFSTVEAWPQCREQHQQGLAMVGHVQHVTCCEGLGGPSATCHWDWSTLFFYQREFRLDI